MQHTSLAAGRWFSLSLAEQLGNVGSEVSRAAKAADDQQRRASAVERALELLDLTLADPRWIRQRRLREIARARELVVDAYVGGTAYGTTFAGLLPYFDTFALAARQARS